MRGKVVVVTGASSGLGRETAVQFARCGAAVVLAARRGAALAETARLCRDAGGTARCVVTDVTHEADVNRLVEAALDVTGEIDTWVNNAGVTLFAELDQGTFDEHRRVIETNLLGPMLCARAVVPIFRRQEEGVLINVSSILGKVGQPLVPSYVVSKFGLHGLSETLRTAVADWPDIHVCTIYPYAMNTPHFEAGANRVGRQAVPVPPTQAPEKVANAIVHLAQHPRREMYVPGYARLGLLLHELAPRPVERLIHALVHEWGFTDAAEPAKRGNLFAPSHERPQVYGRPPKGGVVALAGWLVRRVAGVETPAREATQAPAIDTRVRQPV